MAPIPFSRPVPPTLCVLLTNMFEPPGPTRGADFNVDEIREDVAEEVEQHGKITHIAVDAASAGNVYIKLGTIEVIVVLLLVIFLLYS